MTSDYLLNPYCTFTPLSDFSKQKRLIVTSLFRMSTGGYKPFTKYTDGLRRVSELCISEGLHLVVFVDHTVLRDADLMRALRALRKTSLVRYSCDPFKRKGFHIGVFGTLVRFFPLFDLPGNKAETVFTIDADATENAVASFRDSQLKVADHLAETGLSDKVRLAYYGNHNHINADIVSDSMRTRDKTPHVMPYCVADSLIAMKNKASPDALFDFMEELKPYMGNNPPKLLMSDYIRGTENKHTMRRKCVNNFCFGADEFFVARRLFPRLVAEGVPFAYGYGFSLINHLYAHVTGKVVEKHRDYYRILSGYFREMGYDRVADDIEAGVKLSPTALEDNAPPSSNSRSASKMTLADLDRMMYVLPRKTGKVMAGANRFAERYVSLLARKKRSGDLRVFKRSLPVQDGALEYLYLFAIRPIYDGKAMPLIKIQAVPFPVPLAVGSK